MVIIAVAALGRWGSNGSVLKHSGKARRAYLILLQQCGLNGRCRKGGGGAFNPAGDSFHLIDVAFFLFLSFSLYSLFQDKARRTTTGQVPPTVFYCSSPPNPR